MCKECIHKGSGGVAGRRVGDHSRGFVDDQKRRILEQHMQGNVLGLGIERLGRRNSYFDPLPHPEPIGLSRLATIDPDPTLGNQGLHASSGERRILSDVDVEPIPGSINNEDLPPLLSLLQS
jgi:hypothetical protein